MAAMSPVTTTVSGPLVLFVNVTVVSRVLGRQFENSHASSGSRMREDIDSMAASTALLRKRRANGAGRLETKLVCVKPWLGENAAEPTRAATPPRKPRRDTHAFKSIPSPLAYG